MKDLQDLIWFPTDCLMINNQWQKPIDGKSITLINPSDGSTLCDIAAGTKADIDLAVHAARAAFHDHWSHVAALERGRILAKIGQLVTDKIDALAHLEAMDVGKPLSQARADAIALARYMEFYAGCCDKLHGETIPFQNDFTVYTLREPHGVTGHIIAWNYPMQIIGRSIGAALAAGNACVLKPAEEACLTALAFAEIAKEAGLPEGVLNIVPGRGIEAGRALSEHEDIDHMSFTGSVGVGQEIQSAAAKAVVPVTLELGGKSPQLVFEDADLDKALPFLVNAGIQNAGQTCSASSRILVHTSRFNEVSTRMAVAYQDLKVGPALSDQNLGPLISHRQKTIVESYLDRAGDLKLLAKGTLAAEATTAGAAGAYVAPHLFGPVPPDHIMAQEEIFGPVQVIIPFNDEAEAINVANGTEFGLVASIWTKDGARQMRVAKELRCGQVFINNYGAGGGVELPFGGVGKSGHGREKGFEALYGFTRLKTIAAFHG